jgi:hypothetical protein
MGEYAPNAPSTLGIAIVCGRSCEWLYRTPRWWKLVYKYVESFDGAASYNRSINGTDGRLDLHCDQHLGVCDTV